MEAFVAKSSIPLHQNLVRHVMQRYVVAVGGANVGKNSRVTVFRFIDFVLSYPRVSKRKKENILISLKTVSEAHQCKRRLNTTN